jgi:hypothetical protein
MTDWLTRQWRRFCCCMITSWCEDPAVLAAAEKQKMELAVKQTPRAHGAALLRQGSYRSGSPAPFSRAPSTYGAIGSGHQIPSVIRQPSATISHYGATDSGDDGISTSLTAGQRRPNPLYHGLPPQGTSTLASAASDGSSGTSLTRSSSQLPRVTRTPSISSSRPPLTPVTAAAVTANTPGGSNTVLPQPLVGLTSSTPSSSSSSSGVGHGVGASSTPTSAPPTLGARRTPSSSIRRVTATAAGGNGSETEEFGDDDEERALLTRNSEKRRISGATNNNSSINNGNTTTRGSGLTTSSPSYAHYSPSSIAVAGMNGGRSSSSSSRAQTTPNNNNNNTNNMSASSTSTPLEQWTNGHPSANVPTTAGSRIRADGRSVNPADRDDLVTTTPH